MKILGRSVFIGLGAAKLATASLGLASRDFHKSSDRKVDVTFANPVMFKGGETLPAGTYQVEVPENSTKPDVAFLHNDKVMATVRATVVTQEKKNRVTSIDSVTQGNTQWVTAIRPSGWNESLIFSSAGQNGSH
jgi:hypothetical protein